MHQSIKPLGILLPAAALAVIIVLIGVSSLRRYLGLKREGAYLLGVATVLGAVAFGIYKSDQVEHSGSDFTVQAGFAAGFFVLFGVPLAAKLYRAWIGIYATDAEKLPGTAGVRAWLTPGNLLFAIFVSISAYFGFAWPFLSTFALLVLALLAYPIANTIAQSPVPAETQTQREKETLTSEREKVLAMLDAGKITAEESAELLNALGATVMATQPERASLSPQQRLITIGAALVLVGFFLPWFTINPGNELSRMTGQMGNMMNQLQMPGAPSNPMPSQTFNGSFNFSMANINIAGGDVQHGLGWIILLCACAVPALPFVAAQFDAQMRRTASFVALGLGSLLLVYLLTQSLRFLNIGFVLACAGYLVEWIASLKQSGAPAAVPHIAREQA